MNRFVKAAVLAIATAATTLTAFAPANAGDWGRRHHHDRGDAIALGALGLATGVIVGGALANQQPRGRVYIDPPYDDYQPAPVYRERRVYRETYDSDYSPVYRQPRPVQAYGGAYQPWTPSWYRYCAQRYRSFNPDTGTFRGYDGRNYFCTAG
ncbi:BA14K-like protein [Rhizobium sp. RU20A]|uniref:BA14K family protein n=1 Tax=Rhizobium sp. RU20A TaxID=1907412 RepID=UPI0009565EA1|nr:BA14K family protein [Rhizobium sp. RU20A]SIQ25989.1 BA14K-like protein [Rhizobium sp. RU20A]